MNNFFRGQKINKYLNKCMKYSANISICPNMKWWIFSQIGLYYSDKLYSVINYTICLNVFCLFLKLIKKIIKLLIPNVKRDYIMSLFRQIIYIIARKTGNYVDDNFSLKV